MVGYPPTADWLAEIYRGIEAANTFLFVISPDLVASEVCTLEIEYAVKYNKRLAPVVWQETDNVHPSVSAHNWIFLRPEDDFEVIDMMCVCCHVIYRMVFRQGRGVTDE